jgi:hypothetical protein
MGDLPVGHNQSNLRARGDETFLSEFDERMPDPVAWASADLRRVSRFRSFVLNVSAQSVIATAVWRVVVV